MELRPTVYIRAFAGLLFLLVVMAAAVFIAAWTVDYWQAWLFLAVFAVASLAITLYLMKEDPELLERRVRAGPVAEHERGQKIIQSLASVAFIATLVVPGIDHRLGWSTVPAWAVFAGDALVALGFLVVFFVFRENTFASATIGVEAGQRAISTGPYAFVRHPMYAGAILLFVGTPLLLGSWYGLIGAAIIMALFCVRITIEERTLRAELEGYTEYAAGVPYRLIPGVW